MNKRSEKDYIPITSQDFRNAMSQFSGAVNVVTTDGQKGKRGLTVSACCPLSDNPPTVLVCLMHNREENIRFVENGVFCVNTLNGDHQKLSDAFSGKDKLTQEQRFALAEWKTIVSGAPVLSNSLISFDCKLVEWYQHTTHYVLIGQVVGLQTNSAKEALVYLNRNYHKIPI